MAESGMPDETVAFGRLDATGARLECRKAARPENEKAPP